MYPTLRGLPHGELDLNDGVPTMELLRAGWRLFFSSADIFLAYLIYMGVTFGATMVASGIGSTIVGGPMLTGFNYQYLRRVRGENISYGNLFDGFKLFGQTLSMFLLLMLIVTGGFIISMIIGGVALFTSIVAKSPSWPLIAIFGVSFVVAIALMITLKIRYLFIWYLVADGERQVWRPFRNSRELMRGFGWQIFLFIIVCGLFNFLGVLACLVGMLITGPITMLATAMLYDLLCAHKKQGIRDPEYVQRYWEGVQQKMTPRTTPAAAIPEVGPIRVAEPVDAAPSVGPIAPPSAEPRSPEIPPPVEIPPSPEVYGDTPEKKDE